MVDPNMKQIWAGLAMLALLRDPEYHGNFADIAADSWRMADKMEQEAEARDE